MTTKVTIDAHAGWDVEVTQLRVYDNGSMGTISTRIVKAGTQEDFCVYEGVDLHIKELRNE